MKKNIFLFIALTSGYAIAMEESQTHLLVIPGQNGMGGQNVDMVLPYFAKNNLMHHVQTPLNIPDFGQTTCQNYLKEKIEILTTTRTIRDNDHIILHGSSQGTATTINYAAHNPNNIKALILESVMLTGNSAIFHTVDNMMMPEQCDLPESSYYSLPYTAKAVFPSYAPTGEQPINNIDALSTDLPIIILHDTKDYQLSFKDAQALYAYLTDVKKNKNVYLFAQESPTGKHINLLTTDDMEEICAIETILRLHNLLPFDRDQIIVDLTRYQPAVQQEWLDHFEAMRNKEQNLECIDSSVKVASTSFSLYAFGKWLGII
jgi:predicted esterase